jgi:hypothetical protein
MAVAHGTDKELVLAHKAAIDVHLSEAAIPVLYTNVFWGGRSEIKPSEISPVEYARWAERVGVSKRRNSSSGFPSKLSSSELAAGTSVD